MFAGDDTHPLIDSRLDSTRPAWRPGDAHTRPTGCAICGSQHASARLVIHDGTLPAPITRALRLAPSLTAREAAAFDLLGLGYNNRTIARALSISERTTKRHITAILTKLHLESRLQAGLAAMIRHLTAEPGCASLASAEAVLA
jgi:DNA-binding CsgD family transcriptional regulator